MPVSIGNGWGFQSAFLAVTAVVGGVNQVLSNVGAARSIVAGGAIRLTKLQYRIDLAPDVAIGAAVSPVLWRVFVVSGNLPADLSAFQQQAFAAGAQPQIPKLIGNGAPLAILHDLWLDLSAGDPGLNALAEIEFADAGPTVAASETLSVIVMPLTDANIAPAPAIAANAIITVAAFGTGVTVNPQGSASGYAGQNGGRSLPRFDVGQT